ncbi:MAG TPA: flagellar hook capping protein [Candidatus Acetatifactor stercoripullorum]|uniref:Basal-body rod modification protein FlgD n=1 Tax=Candidatus Acetatifactor stercoripullorum TaxID=2838414 RepID=A0A9D1UC93_9FIRM|nr:flagellar hook capping FlgD N-terminal domain-containing protein [uncultured Acetatifactor sp.]HIW82559.1 flagellar hook capping protein [Candidatus Acetatifactor stercoripullorum]
MALVQAVEDGKLVESTSQSSLSQTTGASSDMDKDAFLQLLVAQMKYQDPLEPTSNTEYISQYAQFTQVEQMQNMAKSMDLQRASTLVGEEVYIKTTNSSGETNYVRGKVDYVVYENGKAYLSIGEQLYSIDDLDTVADPEYLAAYDKAYDFNVAINKLPGVNAIGLSDGEAIDELEKIYNEMTDYEKSFLATDVVNQLNKYIEKLEELRTIAGEDEGTQNGEDTEDTQGTEGTGNTDTGA